MKIQIKKNLQSLGSGIIILIGTILTIGFIGTIYAYTNLPSVSSGNTLTSSIWNDLVNKINDIGVKTDNIYDISGNVGIGTNNPSTKLHVAGDLKVDGSRITRKSVVHFNSNTYSTNTNWALGPTFPTITNFKAGSLVKLFYNIPTRNDSTSWGGGYIEPQISFNGGTTWNSLGSSGYDAGVMNYLSPSIGSYSNSILIDPAQSSDFSVTVRFYFKSYDDTITINGNHEINATSGTATVMSGVNGNQHFSKIIVEELY